jgi:hypothetical protein
MMGCAMAKLVSGATGVGPGVIRYIFIRSSLTLTNLAACEGILRTSLAAAREFANRPPLSEGILLPTASKPKIHPQNLKFIQLSF